jgi:hypothetical protein
MNVFGKTGSQNLIHIVTRNTAEGARSKHVNISLNYLYVRWRKKCDLSISDVI